MLEITGIDHIYISVSDMAISEQFYDRALVEALGFRKNKFSIDNEPHIQYVCRHFGFVVRPARTKIKHDPYSPGLHHFCFRVNASEDVDEAARKLISADIQATYPRKYPEYSEDYVATFFEYPDGMRFEVTNYRKSRREQHDKWYKTDA